MLSAGIHANSGRTPDSSIRGDGKRAESVAIAAGPLMPLILISRLHEKSHVVKLIYRCSVLRIHYDRGYRSLDPRRAGQCHSRGEPLEIINAGRRESLRFLEINVSFSFQS